MGRTATGEDVATWSSLPSRFLALRAAPSLDVFIANPIGCYFGGAHAAAFCPSAAVAGVSLWGHPDERDLEVVATAIEAVSSPSIAAQLSLVDLRKLESLNFRAFDKLWPALATSRAGSGSLVTRRAVITRAAPTAALIGKLFAVRTAGCSVRWFDDAVKALSWLGVEHQTLASDLKRIAGGAVDLSMVRDLRRLLDRRPSAKAGAAARCLGVSPRTFQRRLRELGTTFPHEANHARIRTAKRLMRETSRPLKWIAMESGYASPQHFSAAFRACVGMSPSRWRHRTGA